MRIHSNEGIPLTREALKQIGDTDWPAAENVWRNTMRATILLLALSLLPLAGAAESRPDQRHAARPEPEAVILWGPDYAFSITADAGWVIDETIDHSTGKRAGIFPRGVDPHDPAALVTYMFVKTVARADSLGEDLPAYIQNQWTAFKGSVPSATMTPGEPIRTRAGRRAVVNHLRPRPTGPVAVHAYFEEPRAFVLFVLVGQSEKDVKQNLASFKRVVGSYVAMSIPNARD